MKITSPFAAAAALAVAALAFADVGPKSPDLALSPPKASYDGMAHLMREMMPNYRSFWMAFRERNGEVSRKALSNLAAQGTTMSRYLGGGADAESRDHRRRTEAFSKELRELVDGFDALPRSEQAVAVLRLYRTCQSCHEAHAPAEGRRKREYLPQL